MGQKSILLSNLQSNKLAKRGGSMVQGHALEKLTHL